MNLIVINQIKYKNINKMKKIKKKGWQTYFIWYNEYSDLIDSIKSLQGKIITILIVIGLSLFCFKIGGW